MNNIDKFLEIRKLGRLKRLSVEETSAEHVHNSLQLLDLWLGDVNTEEYGISIPLITKYVLRHDYPKIVLGQPNFEFFHENTTLMAEIKGHVFSLLRERYGLELPELGEMDCRIALIVDNIEVGFTYMEKQDWVAVRRAERYLSEEVPDLPPALREFPSACLSTLKTQIYQHQA